MRLVGANLQPFNLGEFTAASGILLALCRWSGLILSSPLQLNDRIIAEIQTTARTEQAARTRSSLRPFERAVRVRHGETEEAAGQTLTDISCNEETTMGSWTYARQRIVPVVAALFGTALLCFLLSDIALAEDAAPPACGGKILEACTPNSGDTAWMLTSVALVLMMTIPGLGLFYAGMVRKKNVGDTVMTSFAVTCLVTILFALLTYSMAFRAGTPFVGGLDRMFLRDILSDITKGGIGNPNPLAATIPESVYICFQMTFAIITPALIAGAFAERMKFSAMLWFIGLWAILVYAPIAHWVWGPDGLLSNGNDQ